MHWEGAMIHMLRVTIDDNDHHGSYVYTDPRLKEILVVAAMYAKQEISFDNDYTIDVINSSIDPDPYDEDDTLFMNMVTMRAACIMDHGLFRSRALMSGLEAKVGPATLKTQQYLQGFKDILELGPCAIYEKLKEENAFSGDALNSLIHFVLSPFVGNEFDPTTSLRGYYDDERNFR